MNQLISLLRLSINRMRKRCTRETSGRVGFTTLSLPLPSFYNLYGKIDHAVSCLVMYLQRAICLWNTWLPVQYVQEITFLAVQYLKYSIVGAFAEMINHGRPWYKNVVWHDLRICMICRSHCAIWGWSNESNDTADSCMLCKSYYQNLQVL